MADTVRDDLQRQADGYVRQGRLDAAIGAFEQLVQLPPTDWNLVKQLADLQERAGHREAAATRFLQCADYFFGEGFLARAAALYRKVLKLDPKSEHALGKLADVSLELKLKMDARQALLQLVALRRERGNDEGARAAGARLAALDGEEVRVRAPWQPEPAVVPAPPVEPVVYTEPTAHVELPPDSAIAPPAPSPEPAPEPEPERASEPDPDPEPVGWDIPEPNAADTPHDEDAWASLLSTAQPPAPAPSPAPSPAVVPAVLTDPFDWGALLGRDVETSAPLVVLPPHSTGLPHSLAFPSAPDDFSADGPDQVDAVARGQEIEEVDLTDLLDQLAADTVPTMSTPVWQQPAAVTPPDASPSPLPAATFEWPPADAPYAPIEALALAGIGSEAQSDADPRAVAARQLAAGRVFAAAGLVAEAARAFERASRDVRTRFEAAEALGTLHRSRGQMSEAVRWYDEASQAPVADEAVRRPVLYDLADVLEAVGQPGRALAVLLELLSDVEDYRDARARAERLLRVDAGG